MMVGRDVVTNMCVSVCRTHTHRTTAQQQRMDPPAPRPPLPPASAYGSLPTLRPAAAAITLLRCQACKAARVKCTWLLDGQSINWLI
jgi:hypothetical protein